MKENIVNHTYQTLFKDAIKQSEAGERTDALNAFTSLLTIISEDRRAQKSTLFITQIQQWIERTENPEAYQRKIEAQKAEEDSLKKEALKQQKLLEMATFLSTRAEGYFKKDNYQLAARDYGRLVVVNECLIDIKPSDKADAYWNLALTYEHWSLTTRDKREQSALQTLALKSAKLAKQHYPNICANDHKICSAFIARQEAIQHTNGCNDYLPHKKSVLKKYEQDSVINKLEKPITEFKKALYPG